MEVAGSSEALGVALTEAQARCVAGEYQRVLVFGSFLIVGPALDYLEAENLEHVGSR